MRPQGSDAIYGVKAEVGGVDRLDRLRLDPKTVRNDLLLRVAKGTHFTCFIVRNVQILTLRGQQCVRLAMQASPLDMTPPLRLTWRRGCSRYSVYLLYEYKSTNTDT